ncbi:MAG: CpsD/CapB family tyrosine-protein kinase [Planctomycetota bacterium]|nr:MAG: CpsD/CapB family tyrosine-protein kinase [Planctomycetota bacterium]
MIGEKGHDLTPDAAGDSLETAAAIAVPTASDVSSEAHDAIEQLWGSVFFSTERKAPKSIVVTASESGEGATYIATALALTGSSTEYGMRIALVDFNIRNPQVAQIVGVRPSPGVVDVITGDVPLKDAIVPSEKPRLDILPAGGLGDLSMSLLQGKNIEDIIRKLAENYDHVIIDAPPVNRYATVQAIAGFTDGVILVVKAGVTRRESVAEAKKRIELAQGKVIGVVLNQRVFTIPGFLYRRL